MSRRWIYYRLEELAAVGRAVQVAEAYGAPSPRTVMTMSSRQALCMCTASRASARIGRMHFVHVHMHESRNVITVPDMARAGRP